MHCVSSFGIRNSDVYKHADILHIHGIHGGYFNYLALPGLTEKKPAVFTLHDMWSFTGHCTYSYDCERWKDGCGNCPYPGVYPPIKKDRTHVELRLKSWVYRRSDLSIVAPSRWMADLAGQSILGNLPIHHIPNSVDTETYRPLDRSKCREVLGLDAKNRVLMFMAMRMDSNPEGYRKGVDLLVKALQGIPESLKKDTVVLLMGKGGDALAGLLGLRTLHFGYIGSDTLKAICYNAADLFIHPSRADNMPLVLLESMASGTPVVSFDTGGISDSIRHRITGYLAKPGNVEDFRRGILELLEDEDLRHGLSENCRSVALREYDTELFLQRHINLYRQILNH
jgi:glycosyltransferase involved in cell wall biosynthesis